MRSINITFPITDDPDKNNYVKTNKVTKKAFSSNLLLLLLTEKGERYYMPDYGTNLLKYLFDPSDNITYQDIEEDIRNTVSKYIPNLKIKKINFKSDSEEESQVNVNIKFTYKEDSFTEDGDLDLNF